MLPDLQNPTKTALEKQWPGISAKAELIGITSDSPMEITAEIKNAPLDVERVYDKAIANAFEIGIKRTGWR
ncbi:MAG: hypothetical protein R2875_09790 [Desulfobacterales bacterium]